MKTKRLLSAVWLILLTSVLAISTMAQTVTVHLDGTTDLYDALEAQGITDYSTIKSLKLTGTMRTNDYAVIRNLMSALEDVDLSGTNIKEVPDNLFRSKTTLKTCRLPENITIIGYECFYDCFALNTVTFGDQTPVVGKIVFPESLSRIRCNVFWNCDQLRSIDFTASTHLEELESDAFYSCDNLREVLFPSKGNIRISWDCFGECNSLKEFTITKTISYLDGYCLPRSIEKLYVENTTPPSCSGEAFNRLLEDGSPLIAIYIPKGTKKAYSMQDGWSKVYTKLQELGYQLKITGDGNVVADGRSYGNAGVCFPSAGTVTTLQMAPATGYAVQEVKFNGTAVTLDADNSYTIPAAITSGILEVVFTKKAIELEIVVQGSGSYVVNGQTYTAGKTLQLEGGDIVTLQLQPSAGNFVKQVLVFGEEAVLKNGGTTITTPALSSSGQVKIVFADNNEVSSISNITFAQTGYGTIIYHATTLTGGDKITVSKGLNATFQFVVDGDTQLQSVVVNGEDVTSQIVNGQLTIANVSEDLKIEVTFFSSNKLVIDNPDGGALNNQIVAQGGNPRQLTYLKVNGKLNTTDWTVIKNLMNNLEEIDLTGTNITEVPEQAFREKRTLKMVKLPTTVTRIRSEAFRYCSALTTIEGCDNVQEIEQYAFNECNNLRTLPFGNKLTHLHGWDALSGCWYFPEYVTMPATLKWLGESTFNGCSSIKTIDLSFCTALEGLGYNCIGQASEVILPESGSYYVGWEGFRYSQLTELVLPENVYRLDNNVVPSTLERLYVKAMTPINCDQNAFADAHMDACILYVPTGCSTEYQLATGWSNFLDVREFGFKVVANGQGVVKVGSNTYKNNEVCFPVVGTATTLQFVPSTGYSVQEVKFNGTVVTLDADNSYTIPATTSVGTVEVTFTNKAIELAIVMEGNGSYVIDGQTYTASTTLQQKGGDVVTLQLLPADGNFVKQVVVLGEEIILKNGAASVSTPALAESSQVKIVFADNSEATSMANITLAQTGYGSVRYQDILLASGDKITVKKGEDVTLGFVFDESSRIESLLVNGADVTSQVVNGQWSQENVSEDLNIEVTFFSINHLTIDNANGGELGTLIVAQGGNARKVKTLKVNGKLTDRDWSVIQNLMESLEEIDLSGTDITSIPENAFNHKELLKRVVLPTTVTAIQNSAFHMDGPTALESVEGCDNVTTIGDQAFVNCVNLKTLPFGNKLTRIDGWNTFYGCTSLPEKITLPASFQYLGAQAFREIPSLETLDLSLCTNLEALDYLSVGCITTLILPASGSYRLGGEALRNSQITELILPANVSRIDNDVMPSTLKRLYVKAVTPIDCDQSAFDDVNIEECQLMVPIGSASDYQMAPGWNKFLKIEEYGLRVKVGSEGVVNTGSQTITGEGRMFPNANETITLQIVPQAGWHTSEVKLNNTPVPFEKNQIVLSGEQATGTLTIAFAINTFDFAIQTIGDGQVLLGEDVLTNGQVLQIDSASVVTFTLKPAVGKVVAQIKLNDEETLVQNGGTTFVTPAIVRNSVLKVTFAESGEMGDFATYNVKTDENGTIEFMNTTLLPETSIQMPKGKEAVFTLKPNTYYVVQSVTMNGTDITAQVVDNTLTIQNVDAAAQLEVTFKAQAEVTVAMETPGTLNTKLNEELRQKVTKLTITGPLDWSDFVYMRDQLPLLSVLDLWQAECGEIPDRAFNISEDWDNETGKNSLAQVRLPQGTYRIGYRAFAGCANLVEVNFEELTQLNDISGWAFARTGLRRADLSHTVITGLGDYQFRRASKLEYVALPNTITYLGNVFQENSVLTEIDLSNCTKLADIGDAFTGDRKLEKVVLPEGLKNLNYTFNECNALTSVNFPKSLEIIGDGTFYNTKIKSADLRPLTKLQRIGGSSFQYCRELAELTLPDGLDRLCSWAFHDCDALKSVDMSKMHLTRIENYCFYSCNNLESVKLPQTLVTIEENAFADTKINGILELPATLKEIGSWTFGNTQVAIIKSLATTPPALGDYSLGGYVASAFVPEGSASAYKSAPIWEDLVILDKDVIADVTVTAEGTLAASIMEQTGMAPGLITHLTVHGPLNDADFAMMRSNMNLLYDLNLEDADVTTIPSNAFADRKVLMNLKLPHNLQVIQESAFRGCSSLSGTLVLPNSVTTIGNTAFQGCTSLSGVTLSSSLSAIRSHAFEGCSNLTQEITFPSELIALGDHAFANCNNLYGKVTFNSKFSQFIDWDGNETSGGYVFENCNRIEAADLSACDLLKVIPSEMFNECNTLTSVLLPHNLERIEGRAFRNCRSLAAISFPEPLQVINNAAFEGCTSLRSVSLSNCKDFRLIESYAFTGCSSLETVSLPQNLKEIQEYAFNECRALSSLSMKALQPANLGDNAFRRVNTENCLLSVPMGCASKYQLASGWSSFFNVREFGLRILVGSEGKLTTGDQIIMGDEAFDVKTGETATFQIVPQPGWHASEVLLNKTPIAFEQNQFTLTSEQATGTLSVAFAINTFDFKIQSTGNGQVLLGDVVLENNQVLHVDSVSVMTFTLRPAEGYMVTAIALNGEESVVQNGGKTYVTPAIARTSALSVTFAQEGEQGSYATYNIKTGENGTIEYKNTTLLSETSIQVPKGKEAVFTLKPSPNYVVHSVTMNGTDITDQVVDGQLKIENVTVAAQLEVTFRVQAELTIDMAYAGQLSKLLSEESKQRVTKLTIRGPLNWNDFYFMRDELPQLSVLDLWQADCGEIPDRAFNISEEWENETGKKSLTQVRLPQGTYRIGYRAFAGCTNLVEVNFEELTQLNDISGWAFTRTGLRRADLSHTAITNLWDCQFRRIGKLEYVALPSTLTDLGNAFTENQALTEVDLSNSTNLTNLGDAFSGDRSLVKAVLPEGLKNMNNTFNDCQSLTSVNFPKSLETIGDWTFVNTKITSADLRPLTKLQRIGSYAFYNCKELSELTLPDGLERLSSCAFQECDALKSVDMSKLQLTTIEGYAFSWCDNLESVKLPKTLVNISEGAFQGTKLSGILELPATMAEIGNWAFDGTQITLVKSGATTPPALGENALGGTVVAAFVPQGYASVYQETPRWEDLTILDKEVRGEVTVTREGNLAIDIMEQVGVAPGLITHLKVHGPLNATDFAVLRSNMTLLYDLDLEDANVSIIPDNAFLEKKILMNLKLPKNLLTIQDNAFRGCSALSGTLTLPASLTTIGWAAFQGCSSLNGIVFNDALEVIRGYAFEGCTNLTQEITFPDNLLSLGYYAFANCRNLFGKVKFNPDFYIFMGSEGYWSETGRAFEGCNRIEEVDLSECDFLYEIPSATFNECSSLTTVKLPPYIERIDDFAFNNCRSLTSINFPTSLLVINYYAFSGCSSLRSIDLSDCKTFGTIEGYAFNGCSSLETVNLPKSLNWIREYAFNECRALANLNVEALQPADLGEYVFRRVNTGKCVLSIPTGTYYDYLTAAQWGAFVQMRNAIDITLDEGANLSYSNNANLSGDGPSQIRGRYNVRRGAAGSTQIGDANVKDGTSLYVSEDETVTFYINPDENVSIKQVLFNGEDVTDQMVGNSYETPVVTEASSFKVLLNIDGPITVKELRMTETDLAIKVAESHQILAAVYPNNATNKNIFWTSSDETVAKVLEDGTVTGLKAGRTTITARTEDGDFTKTCEVVIMSNDYYVTFDDLETYVQNEVQVPVFLHNTDNASAIQFDVYLPEGVGINQDNVWMTGRSNGHSVTTSRRSDGSVRVIVYSNDGNAFYEHDGHLLTLPITTQEEVGDFTIEVKNIHVSGPNYFDFVAPDYSARIKVSDYPIGDSNGNGEVTVTDVANIVDHLLERWTERFVTKAADANIDGIISVSDIIATIDIILGHYTKPANAPARRRVASRAFDRLYLDDFVMTAGSRQDIELKLENAGSYTAFQCDIFLPDGISVARDTEGHLMATLAGANTSSHVVSADYLESGALRIMVYSMQNEGFNDSDAGVLKLTLEATDEAPAGIATIDVRDVRLVSNSDHVERLGDDSSSNVDILNPTDIGTLMANGNIAVHVQGHQLIVQATKETTLQLVSADGKARTLRLQPGENRFHIGSVGVYMIGGQKVFIK